MIKVLDICSGIGGFSLGLESTGKYETVAFCENEPFCKKVLNKHWPDVPIYNDLKELGNDPEKIQEEFDLICGGIPCQPFSVAGRKKGKEDDRHLWPYMFEIIKQKTPTWVIVENVGGFVNVALDDVCLDLETEGYATQSFIIPACGIEAPHRRDRVWIIGKNMGDSEHNGSPTPKVSRGTSQTSNHNKEGEDKTREPTGTSGSRDKQDMENTRRTLRQGGVEQGTNENEIREGDANKLERSSSTPELDVANTNDTGRNRTSKCKTDGVRQEIDEGWQGQSQSESSGQSSINRGDMADAKELSGDEHVDESNKQCDEEQQQGVQAQLGGESGYGAHFQKKQWEFEPAVGRVANGIPDRVDRLKALGNAIVPQIIYHIGIAIANEEMDSTS